MKLASLLRQDLMFWDFNAKTREDVYRMVAHLVSQHFNLGEALVLDAFLKRDELGHMVLGDGFLIPHARLEGLDDLIIVVVKCSEPVEVNGSKADFFFALLTGHVSSNLYLKAQATLVTLLKKEGNDLKNQTTPAAFLKRVGEIGGTLTAQLSAHHIMTTPVITARPDESLLVTINAMKKNNITYLPVVDENNRCLGKIDLLDILSTVYPDYLRHIPNLSFLSELRAFETLAEREAAMTVNQVYVRGTEQTVEEDISIIALGFTILKQRWNQVTVLDREGRVVGVVSLLSILHNVVRL